MTPNNRADCGEIVENFKVFKTRCAQDRYCTERVSKPQRVATNLSELMAAPSASSFQGAWKKPEVTPITEQDSKALDTVCSDSSKPNGLHSLHKTRRVSTAPELWNSSYNTEQAAQPVPERRTKNGYAMESIDVDGGVDVNMKQDKELSSPKKVYFNGKDQLKKPPLETKNSDDSAVDMTYDKTAGSALESTQNKRDMSKEVSEEITNAQPRKRARH